MFEKFSERARKVMSLARQEAQRLNSECIGTEHILLGIIQEGGGVAATVLKNLNVDLKRIRQEVDELVKPSTGPITTLGQLPYSPRAKNVIELAGNEASQLGHDVIGTEHLLLGLLKENEGIAAQVLTNLGLKLAKVRDMVLEVLGPVENKPLQKTQKHMTSDEFTAYVATIPKDRLDQFDSMLRFVYESVREESAKLIEDNIIVDADRNLTPTQIAFNRIWMAEAKKIREGGRP